MAAHVYRYGYDTRRREAIDKKFPITDNKYKVVQRIANLTAKNVSQDIRTLEEAEKAMSVPWSLREYFYSYNVFFFYLH